MNTLEIEYVVDHRDEHGQPAVIRCCIPEPPSDLKTADDKRLPKKRLRERQALKQKDQAMLHTLFNLPYELERAREVRIECENALNDARNSLKEREEGKAEDVSDPQPGTSAVAVSSPPLQSVVYRPIASSPYRLHYLYGTLCVVFFLMALFPSFREWVIREFIVKFCIDYVAPPITGYLCGLGEQFSATFPLTSHIILTLYKVFGFWGLAIGFLWFGCKLVDVISVIRMSVDALVFNAMKN
jgi:hypothetical protein